MVTLQDRIEHNSVGFSGCCVVCCGNKAGRYQATQKNGARLVHQIISTINWIQTSRLSMKNFLSSVCCGDKDEVLVHTAGCKSISAPICYLVRRNPPMPPRYYLPQGRYCLP